MKVLIVIAGLLLATAGCGSANSEPSTLTVFAAASLKSSFTTLGAQFESTHPGTKVNISYAGSSDLATQLTQGAPADVFASADTKNMTRVSDAGLTAGAPVNFASNTLQIAVAPGNPLRITGFADLAKPGVKLVTCAPQVPCGAATQKLATESGTRLAPVSEEASVTDVLNKVSAGEADAGLVYVTDVRAAGSKVTGVSFPLSAKAVNTYPIAALKGARNPQLATEFVQLVAGAPGRAVLAAAGFGAP